MGPPPTGEAGTRASKYIFLAPLLRDAKIQRMSGCLGLKATCLAESLYHTWHCSTRSFTWLASALQDLPSPSICVRLWKVCEAEHVRNELCGSL